MLSRKARKANVGTIYRFEHGKYDYELRFVDKDGTHFFRKLGLRDEGGFIMSAANVKTRLINTERVLFDGSRP